MTCNKKLEKSDLTKECIDNNTPKKLRLEGQCGLKIESKKVKSDG